MSKKISIQKQARLANFQKLRVTEKTTEETENVTCMKVYMYLNLQSCK